MSLDKPVRLTEEEQVSIDHLRSQHSALLQQEYEDLLQSNDNQPDMSQPFVVPMEAIFRAEEDEHNAPKKCLARLVILV